MAVVRALCRKPSHWRIPCRRDVARWVVGRRESWLERLTHVHTSHTYISTHTLAHIAKTRRANRLLAPPAYDVTTNFTRELPRALSLSLRRTDYATLYVPIRSITLTSFCSFFLAVFNQVHFLATLCLIRY